MYFVRFTRPNSKKLDITELMEDRVRRHKCQRLPSTIVKKCSEVPADVSFDQKNAESVIGFGCVQIEQLTDMRFDDLDSHYKVISKTKKNGGKRIIHNPDPYLRNIHKHIMNMLHYYAYYHTSAFAYIENRSIYDCLKRHQDNGSRWFLHVDLKDFFGSTSYDFAMKQIFSIYPYCSLQEETKKQFENVMRFCFLNDRLPQGTTVSPMLTNLIMLPIDHRLYGFLHKKKMVYTRYADDIIISSEYDFDYRKVIEKIQSVMAEFDAPYQINEKKTRYGSSAGRNWNLGLMLNKDGNITVGYRNKKILKARLTEYCLKNTTGIGVSKTEEAKLFGLISYYKMIEPATIEHIENKLKKKFHFKKNKPIVLSF